MKALLLILLVTSTLSSQAQQTGAPLIVETNSTLSVGCIIMITLMGLFMAGLTYFLVTKNRRRNIKDDNSSVKGT